MTSDRQDISLSIRLDLPNGHRIGPGKLALLKAICETGSISGAAKTLGLSYPRALKLIAELNESFTEPLIATHQGGADRGGATLTDTGARVLHHCETVLAAANEATKKLRTQLPQIAQPKFDSPRSK